MVFGAAKIWQPGTQGQRAKHPLPARLPHEAEHYDIVIGDEAWDVDYYYHENPELKRQPFVFLTDFVGMLPVEGDERELFLCADRNADDIEHIARFPYLDRKSTRLNSSHANISY